MENNEKLLEEKAKEFFKLIVLSKFGNRGFNPIEIKNVEEYMPEINYLVDKKYLLEGKSLFSLRETVKSVRYKPSFEGKNWALK